MKVLTPILKKDDGSERYPQAFEALLASGHEPALKLACDVLQKERHRGDGDIEPMVLRLFLRERAEALKSLLTRLDSAKKIGATASLDDGQSIEYTVADDTAESIDEWRKETSYRMDLPAPARQALREKQKAWLREQFALIKAGQKPAIDPPGPLPVRRWMIDAP